MKVRLGLDSLPNIAISVAETSGNYIRCFTQTRGGGAGKLGRNNITWGQANKTGMPTNQKSKQS
jgi:hypothetical protein